MIFFLSIFIIYFAVCAYVYHSTCGGQRIILKSQFSPTTLWDPRLSGLRTSTATHRAPSRPKDLESIKGTQRWVRQACNCAAVRHASQQLQDTGVRPESREEGTHSNWVRRGNGFSPGGSGKKWKACQNHHFNFNSINFSQQLQDTSKCAANLLLGKLSCVLLGKS